MNKLKLSVIAVLAYVVLVVGFGIASSPSATGQGQSEGRRPATDVRVVNGASQPVPVTGSVAVSSLPAVQVGSLPAVQLDTSTPIPVTNVGQPAQQPFGKGMLVFTATDSSSESFTVPADKRLYIETVSVRGSIPQGHIPLTAMEITTGGERITHPLPVTFRAFDGILSDTYHGLHEVRMVADPGSEVTFRAARRSGGGNMALAVTVSGHLVDIQ